MQRERCLGSREFAYLCSMRGHELLPAVRFWVVGENFPTGLLEGVWVGGESDNTR